MSNAKGKTKSKKQTAIQYAKDVVSGKEKRAGAEVVAACERFLADLERDDLELRTKDPNTAIAIMLSNSACPGYEVRPSCNMRSADGQSPRCMACPAIVRIC